MSVAKVSEISATSTKSFEDAIQQGLTRASKTLRRAGVINRFTASVSAGSVASASPETARSSSGYRWKSW